MRGITPFFVLFATFVDATAGHVVNVHPTQHQHDGSRALAAVHDANEVDMFYDNRRLEPLGESCCGWCKKIVLFPVAEALLVSVGPPPLNVGVLNPAFLGVEFGVTIIIRHTLIFTDNNAADPSLETTLVIENIVEPEDWNETLCSFLEDHCIVFQNDEIIMFAPAAQGEFATITINSIAAFTAASDVEIISVTGDVRCQVAGACDQIEDADGVVPLEPDGPGTPLGTPILSTFHNGFCDPWVYMDPHVSGLRGQRYDWFGEDGGWYAFLSSQDQLHMNLRVTSHLPTSFPERQLVTGVALVTDGGHTITVEIVDPLDLAPTCQHKADASVVDSTVGPCLVNGALRVTVDGHAVMPGAGEYHFNGGIRITAVNLPLECQRFGDYLMWGNLEEDQKLMHAARNLRATDEVTSIFDWLLADSVMIAPPWCVKYLDELDGDVTALASLESNHAVFRIESPNISLRVNVGINSEQEQTLEDGRVVPTASFWQMDVRVEDAAGIAMAKGMLGETARQVHDKETGKVVMSGLGVLRGDVEDYRVMHPLGTEFKQKFLPEE